jgi:hypothetical protein
VVDHGYDIWPRGTEHGCRVQGTAVQPDAL